MVVHQLLPRFAATDGASQVAVHLRLLARRRGHWGELYAADVRDGLGALALPSRDLDAGPVDLVLHHRTGDDGLATRRLSTSGRAGLVLHTLEPVEALAPLTSRVELAIGLSGALSARLAEAGFQSVHTVLPFVEPERFTADKADPQRRERLKAPGGPAVLSWVGAGTGPSARDLLDLHAELLRSRPSARLLLMGARELPRAARKLAGVQLLGPMSHAERVAALHAATLYVCMDEAEPVRAPLLEAMAAGVPVLAYASDDAMELLDGHGVAFTDKDFAVLAELALELSTDEGLRGPLRSGQAARLEQLSAAAEESLGAALATLQPGARVPAAALAERSGPSADPALVDASSPRGAARRERGPEQRRPRVALLVQRFGAEVSGGAERHAEQVGRALLPHFDLTVLTTCAKDHLTWRNELPRGRRQEGPFEVVRFPSVRPRVMFAFNALSRLLFGRAQDRIQEEAWLATQGPFCPGLLRHLAEDGGAYDAVIGFTYLYAPTAWGVPLVAQRALVVPTAHDEPPLGFGIYSDVFERPRALLCNTPEEVALIDRRFPKHAPARVVGVGVEMPEGRPERFAKKFNQRRPYLLYVGRVEAGKGIAELIEHHAALRQADPTAPDLVLAGRASMQVRGEHVRALGPISDEDKFDGLKGAAAVVVPSRYESLSLLALEAFGQGTPVIANGQSEVLEGQVRRSQAGRCYLTEAELVEAVRTVARERDAMSERALAFAKEHSWDRVVSIYREEVQRIMAGAPA